MNRIRNLDRLAAGAIAFSLASLIGPMAGSAHAVESPEAIILSQRNVSPVDADAGINVEPDTTASSSDNPSERIAVPGTSVSLSPPPSFILSEQFSGFVNEENLSSIVLTELPGEAYSELREALSSTPEEITELFASRGVVLDVENVSRIAVEGTQAPFIKGTQTAAGIAVQKYFVLLGGESTILLTFNVLDERSLSEQSVIDTIQSVVIAAAPSIEQKVAELPFTFAIAEPFEVLDVLLGSSVVLVPKEIPEDSEDVPLIIIASSISQAQTADLAEYSTYLLKNTEGFANAVVTEQSPVEFAGSSGYFTRAQLDNNVVLQYLSIQPDDFYVRMVVLGNLEEIERLSPVLRTIQESVAVE